MPRKGFLLAILAFLMFAGTGVAWAIYSWVVPATSEVSTAPNLPPVVSAAPDVTGLYPGVVVPYKLTVKNPNPYPIRVTGIEGYNPKTNVCTDYAIAFAKKSRQELQALVIPGGQTRDLGVKLQMKDWAPKECADQKLPLNVVVHAQQATAQ